MSTQERQSLWSSKRRCPYQNFLWYEYIFFNTTLGIRKKPSMKFVITLDTDLIKHKRPLRERRDDSRLIILPLNLEDRNIKSLFFFLPIQSEAPRYRLPEQWRQIFNCKFSVLSKQWWREGENSAANLEKLAFCPKTLSNSVNIAITLSTWLRFVLRKIIRSSANKRWEISGAFLATRIHDISLLH